MPTTTNLIRSLAVCAAITLALAVPPARAHRSDGGTCGDHTARGGLVDVEVLVAGQPAPLYVAPGRWDRRYFEAFRDRTYALRVHNRTDRRVGVLISVDGLNVVNGERSHQGRDESMYVLDPRETATIRGWRTSLDEVRRFVFVDEQRSYATRTGQANGDMGWIRVLAFAERRARAAWPQRLGGADERGSGATPEGLIEPAPLTESVPQECADRVQSEEAEAPQASAKSHMRGGRLDSAFPGTGWGERRADPVRETWFVAAAAPGDRLVFRYEYASGLLALGIRPESHRLDERERGELGFAKPPKW